MSKLEQAARQALVFIESLTGLHVEVKEEQDEIITALREALDHSGAVTDMVSCTCGDLYPADSFGAGFIAATGHCQNCYAAEQAEQEPVALLQLAADALVYHTEQTRPIQNTIDVLAAIQKFKEKQR